MRQHHVSCRSADLENKSRKATLYLRASLYGFLSSFHCMLPKTSNLSVIFKHLREAGRILAQRLNRVKKKRALKKRRGCD